MSQHAFGGGWRDPPEPEPGAVLAGLLLVVIIVLFVVLGAVITDALYGDWRCMFARCTIVR